MMGIIVVLLIAAIVLEVVFVFYKVKNNVQKEIKIKEEKEKEAQYDIYYMNSTLRNLGYEKCDDSDIDFYKNISDTECLYITLSKHGLIASWYLEDESLVLPDECMYEVEEKCLEYLEEIDFTNHGDLSVILPDALEYLVNPNEKIDMYILDKIEKILYKTQEIVTPYLVNADEYYEE